MKDRSHGSHILLEDKVLDILPHFDSSSFDACFCDPPYFLEFMGKEFDKQHKLSPGTNDGQRMQAWHEEWCREIFRVLKPGAHILTFGGTRTYHRLVSALEDVGFEIRDCLMWLYGSGFPKSLDISKSIDKRGGYPHLSAEIGSALKSARQARGLSAAQCDRMFCGGTTNWTWFEGRPTGQRAPSTETFALIAESWPELNSLREKVAEAERKIVGQSSHKPGIGNKSKGHYTVGGTEARRVNITAPSSSNASLWSGYGTALKPAWEPIILAMKPLDGTFAQNALNHNVCGLNIDETRISIDNDEREIIDNRSGKGWGTNQCSFGGRGEGKYRSHNRGRWPANLLLSHTSLCTENGCHPFCSIPSLDRQSGFTKSRGSDYNFDYSVNTNPTRVTKNIKSGIHFEDSGGASRFFYCSKVSTRERNLGGIGCKHPTLKPISLCAYLSRLLLPPSRDLALSSPRRLLIPFSGAGSEVIGSLSAGWDEIIGIEQDTEYMSWAEARIDGWKKAGIDTKPVRRYQAVDVDAIEDI